MRLSEGSDRSNSHRFPANDVRRPVQGEAEEQEIPRTFQCHAPFRLSTTFEWPFRLPLIAIFLFLLAPFRLPLIAIFLFLLGLQKP
mmetsp:Transcript_37006/g.118631  ORF Transcript_37006/g.118631 Transcript_37006/m.118631 type:complete len:86 (-) Transcript_37006:21-278(-)